MSLACSGPLQNVPLNARYEAVVFKSGDVFASAGIYGSEYEISHATLYSKSQVGAATAAVLVSYDPDGNPNWGFWTISVDRTTLITTVLLKDTDAPGGQVSWTMTADKCVLNRY